MFVSRFAKASTTDFGSVVVAPSCLAKLPYVSVKISLWLSLFTPNASATVRVVTPSSCLIVPTNASALAPELAALIAAPMVPVT